MTMELLPQELERIEQMLKDLPGPTVSPTFRTRLLEKAKQWAEDRRKSRQNQLLGMVAACIFSACGVIILSQTARIKMTTQPVNRWNLAAVKTLAQEIQSLCPGISAEEAEREALRASLASL